ncbi:hypothetical protein [Streptomyces albogriseolus]|uniref:hypothetical protein n=1 Tax=Streptomyces albogriseolus TaxID=1887 RepID=UPI00345F57F3
MNVTRPGPEGVKVGDAFLGRYQERWLFTGFNDVAGEPFALDRNGWPVLASELIAHGEFLHRRAAHPFTAVEIRERADLGPQIGTAQSWPDGPDGWADTFEVIEVSPALRKVWVVATGRYLPSTGQQVYRPDHWKPGPLAVVHVRHPGAFARLTLWFESHQQQMYGYRDKEGRLW